MNTIERAAMLKLYTDRLSKFGPVPQALGWTKAKYNMRFKVLLDYWLNQSRRLSILDFGCGLGDLYMYMQRRGIDFEYTGVDINPDLILEAKRRARKARFLHRDIIEKPLSEKFDIVVSSGVHNYALKNHREFAKVTIEEFDRMAIEGFSINFLSDRAFHFNEANAYTSPEEILKLCLQRSQRVLLRHDYMPFEFSVIVDKRNEFDPEMTVFSDLLHQLDG